MYDPEELRQEAEALIKEHELDFFKDLVAYMPCGEKTLYNHNLHKIQSIKDYLSANKIRHKIDVRRRWRESDNFNAQKHYYLLIGTDEEREILSSRPVQNTNIIMPEKELTDAELEAQLDAFRDAQESK